MRVIDKRNLNVSSAYRLRKAEIKTRAFSNLDLNGIETLSIELVRFFCMINSI